MQTNQQNLFAPGLNKLSESDKILAYANLRNQGYSDDALRASANAQFGTQTDSDWGYLQGKAQSLIQPIPRAAQPSNQDVFKYDQKNPYLSQMADTIKSQVNDNLTRNVMPQIASGAQMTGGFGGSRQGVVEANALKDANQGLSNSLSSMYYGDYNNAMNRQLQKYGMDQSYNLGMGNLGLGYQNSNNNFALGLGNLGLGYQNSNQNFYTAQRGQDLQQTALGANLFQQGNQGYLNQGQGIYNLGLTGQQAPWQAVDNFNNASKPYTGFGTTTGNISGSPAAGFMGGALGATQLYNLWNQPQKTT